MGSCGYESRVGCYLNGGLVVGGVCKYDSGSKLRKGASETAVRALSDDDFLQLCYLSKPHERKSLLGIRELKGGMSDELRDAYWMVLDWD